ncbi:MAG TPA: homogentisate 1,2-dioxygenase [Mycobacteriales bacterium]|nr:homogentisate 1,2-dioxygenase [Mycobacteriales bacterium]
MPIYRSSGLLPQKHFTLLKGPHGGWCHEELITHQGFGGETALLYHLRPPTSMLRVEELEPLDNATADTPLRNYLFAASPPDSAGDQLASRRTFFRGEHVSFSLATPTAPTDGFYRNGWSDELVLVTSGSGVLRSAFGDLRYRDLDLVHVPRSVTVQWIPDAVPHHTVVVESTAPISIPPHFRDPSTGQFRESAPYHERDIRAPESREAVDETGEFPILVKYGSRRARYWLDHHPFDVVGWDGYLYPFALNLDDYEPKVGRIDALPDQYQVFVTEGTLMMVIVPRRRADHPDSSPAQPHHMNTDIDEILYRIGGSNRATDPGAGTITLHPRGLAHGPRAGFLDQPKTDMLPLYGFMLDTRDHLQVTEHAVAAMQDNDLAAWRGNP